ncbi:MAG: uracil-DNA glycosylase, partial [Flavobacteriales bacterium]
SKHCILTAPHPSPLGAWRGWFGSKHFSKTNEVLQSWGKTTIKW